MRDLTGPMVCDTPVPFFDAGVSCGLPNELGDLTPEIIMLPSELRILDTVFMAVAAGNSMEGVGIYDGDRLLLDNARHLNSGDIIVARVDGAELVKTYYIDEDGRHWLVPANEQYMPMQLTEDMTVEFCGRVIWNFRRPRDTTRNIRQAIARYKMKNLPSKNSPTVPSYEEVVEALTIVAPLVKAGRRWLGACRVLMDCEFIPKEHYDKFCELVKSILPDHKHLPNGPELQRMAVACFAKPFGEWKDEKAPVHGKHFNDYYEIGKAMLEKLP